MGGKEGAEWRNNESDDGDNNNERTRRKNRRGRETAPGCNIMFTFNEKDVGVSEMKAAGSDKLLPSRVEGRFPAARKDGGGRFGGERATIVISTKNRRRPCKRYAKRKRTVGNVGGNK